MTRIIDTTLREGEQQSGVTFRPADKERIFSRLVACGIDEIEIGIANPQSKDLVSLSSFCRTSHPAQSFSLWCRCLEEDIRWAAKRKPSVLALSIPASDLHIIKKMGKSKKWVLNQLHHSISLALALGIEKVAVGLEDASRANPYFINMLAETADKAGAFRLRLADTVGIASPLKIITMLQDCQFGRMDSAVHCHNDFGMATANTITALEQGVKWADVTILGLGERAGNSRLEEVLAYLATQKDICNYRISHLSELSRFVEKISTHPISPWRPIIGNDIFSCETGLHLLGLDKDPSTYEPFPPCLVGRKRAIFIGRKAGRRSVAASLQRLGLPELDETSLDSLTGNIRALAENLGRPLLEKEIITLATSPGD